MDCLKESLILLFLVVYTYIDNVGGTCQVPTSWQNKSWYMYRGPGNSRAPIRRHLTVGVSHIYGMMADGYAVVVQNWTCYYLNNAQTIIAFKGDPLGDSQGVNIRLYTAFQITDSSNIQSLYPRSGSDINVLDEHVEAIDDDMYPTPTIDQIATQPANGKFYFMFETNVTGSEFEEFFSRNEPTYTTEITTEMKPSSQSLKEAVIIFSVIGSCLIVVLLVFIVLLLKKNNFCRFDCLNNHHSTNKTGDSTLADRPPLKKTRPDDILM